MTDLEAQIKAWEKLAEKATAGPWTVYNGQSVMTADDRQWLLASTRYFIPGPTSGEANAAFIALSRNIALPLIRAYREMREERDRLREALEHEVHCRWCGEDGCINCADCTARRALSGEESKR